MKLNEEQGIDPLHSVPTRLINRKGKLRNQFLCKLFCLYTPQACCLTRIYDDEHVRGDEDVGDFDEEDLESALLEGIGKRYIRTFLESGLPKATEIMYRGHEQTHALLRLNGMHLLEYELSKIGITDARSLFQLSREAICDVGGFYSVMHAYPNEREILLRRYRPEPHGRTAAEWLYQQSLEKISITEPRFGTALIKVKI